VFYDFLKLRLFFFGYFMVLAGCLPQLIFYDLSSDQKCLHTKNVTHCFPRVGGCIGVDIVQTDTRQFTLLMIIWMVTVPIFVFMWLRMLRDSMRYVCVPIIVACLVWQVLVVALAIDVNIKALFFGMAAHWWVILSQTLNLLVFLTAGAITLLYKKFYAKKDMLKTDEEEIDVA
jgi:FlaA1/EpsC-like NDP-sugar epimerase